MKVPVNINPKGGIDLDSDPRSVPEGFIRNALNTRWGLHNDTNGVAENIKGNTEIMKTDRFIGTNTVIGSCRDIPRKAVIWFIHNSSGLHHILKYDTINERIIPVLWNIQALNFSKDYRIYNPKVIDNGEEGILIWTDNYNPPRKLNIKKASEYTSIQYPDLFEDLQVNTGIGFWAIEDDFVVQ